jgi:hypothetical protein
MAPYPSSFRGCLLIFHPAESRNRGLQTPYRSSAKQADAKQADRGSVKTLARPHSIAFMPPRMPQRSEYRDCLMFHSAATADLSTLQ